MQLDQPYPSECAAGPVLALAVVEFLQMKGVSHTSLERELDSRAVNPDTDYIKLKRWVLCDWRWLFVLPF